MTNAPPLPPRKEPPFRVGDNIRVVSPTIDRGKQGKVIEVLEVLGDLVYRYKVGFQDGAVGKFFGFELELIRNSPDSIYPRRAS
jgi:hypothetical protein